MSKNLEVSQDKLRRIRRTHKRNSQIKAGAYDGRYNTKVIPDKKKVYKKPKYKSWEHSLEE